jgi:hypothetical protein
MLSLGLSSHDAGRQSLPLIEVLTALRETATWCAHHSLPANGLRSSMLYPSAILNIPSLNEPGVDSFVKTRRDSYQQAIESIRRKRSELLRNAEAQPVEAGAAQVQGKLLLYEPMETVSDGAAEAASRGFFDMEDAPPWDSWFWLKESTIFCWVPLLLISDAQAGIDANPVDCIRWAEWSRLPSLINR